MVEGNDKGVIELRPTPYNVVLEDDSYKGEIKLGLKFIKNVSLVPSYMLVLYLFLLLFRILACDFVQTTCKRWDSPRAYPVSSQIMNLIFVRPEIY